jgi:hypothetical protein
MGGNLYVHELTDVLVGLDLFKHLPESCLETREFTGFPLFTNRTTV